MLTMPRVSKFAVVVAIGMGIAMMVIGSIFIIMGVDAKGEITEALLKERVITSKDAPIPGVLVEDAETARSQAAAIESHTFGRFGPFAGMEQDDPNRDVYLKGLTLRNSLNLAAVGLGVGDLAVGVGAITLVLGMFLAGFAIPVHLTVMRVYRLHDG